MVEMTWCCSVLQCVAMCCSMLQYVAVCCSVLQFVAVCCSLLQCVALCCNMLQYVAISCSVLQCVAVCCCVLQKTCRMHESLSGHKDEFSEFNRFIAFSRVLKVRPKDAVSFKKHMLHFQQKLQLDYSVDEQRVTE